MAEQVTRSLNMVGEWWIPDKYDDRLMGTLTWKPNEGCLLRLVDDSHDFKWGSSPGIVVGINSDQDPVTLLGCRHAGHAGFKMRGNVSSESHWVQVNCALIGAYFEDESEISLTDLYIGFAGLDEYVIERYYDVERTTDSEGRYRHGPITFSIPQYKMAKTDGADVGLFVSYSLRNEIQLRHKLRISFAEANRYNSEGSNLRLVHEVIPAFLSAMMGHQCFLTSLDSYTDNGPVEIFDGYDRWMSWDGNPQFRNRLVHGSEKTLSHWPAILPAWVENYPSISKLCSAYVKILSDGTDGFFEVNNLVHLFFGLERYYKRKRNKRHSSLWRALKYTICRIDCYFENSEEYVLVADSIDISYLNDARNTLVHSNEGNPDYALVFQQLMFITRCVLLIEMEYPLANVRQETQHWFLWQFFEERRKQEEADTRN